MWLPAVVPKSVVGHYGIREILLRHMSAKPVSRERGARPGRGKALKELEFHKCCCYLMVRISSLEASPTTSTVCRLLGQVPPTRPKTAKKRRTFTLKADYNSALIRLVPTVHPPEQKFICRSPLTGGRISCTEP